MQPKLSHEVPSHEFMQQVEVNPHDYLATVIDLYRKDHADYRGRRNEDQQLIAEYAAEEADEYFDATYLGVVALAKTVGAGEPQALSMPNEEEQKQITLGDFEDGASLFEMRNAWRQLWVGLNILTHRLKRDSQEFGAKKLNEVFDMDAKNKAVLIDSLFGNFQDINALRFGATGSGVRRHRWVTDMDSGEPIRQEVDADKARHPETMAKNAARRRYTVVVSRDKTSKYSAIHPAGKMTPKEFVALRKQYPEIDMDRFANDAAFLKNMASQYESNEA